jgi:hypothetical protein
LSEHPTLRVSRGVEAQCSSRRSTIGHMRYASKRLRRQYAVTPSWRTPACRATQEQHRIRAERRRHGCIGDAVHARGRSRDESDDPVRWRQPRRGLERDWPVRCRREPVGSGGIPDPREQLAPGSRCEGEAVDRRIVFPVRHCAADREGPVDCGSVTGIRRSISRKPSSPPMRQSGVSRIDADERGD